MEPEKPHVAIIGGGVAGVALALSLLHREIPCKIYESEPSSNHHHGNLTIPPQAVRAMELCAPGVIAAYNEAADKRDIFLQAPSTYQVPLAATTDDTKILTRFKHLGGFSSYSRQTFLQVMLNMLPEGGIVYGKKMMQINVLPEGKLVVEFTDHASAVADVVIGCDGAASRTRSFLVGRTHPSARAQSSGQIAYDALVPMEAAAAILGQQRATSTCIHMNYGSCVYSTPVSEGQFLNLTIILPEPASWSDEGTSSPVGKTEVLQKASVWPVYIRTLIKSATDALTKWPLFDMSERLPPYFVQGCVAIIADAAHVSTSHMATNAGAAFEDVLIVAELLADDRVEDGRKKLELALAAYEAVRYQRGCWAAYANHRVSELVTFQAVGVGDNLEKLEEEYEALYHHAYAWRADAAVEEAKGELGKLLAT